ncbi:MAG: ribonuclease H-like domain-containing protein [Phycisphaerae bacterium]|nr:ribonuclease H-like domain-containing protein [Phycisphaerae bacterium]
MDAYLDIETTGLSRSYAAMTVVGVALADPVPSQVFQLVGDEITVSSLLSVLRPAGCLYTYNGSRFDLPFIRAQLGLDLTRHFRHVDLMFACWRNDLKGGLKAVERRLGIARQLPNVDGFMAVQLWWEYVNTGDLEALDTLLAYNREDVLNLHILRQRLCVP